MTPLDEPLSFLIEYVGAVYLLCIVATIACFFFRRSRWISVVWFPSLLVTAGYSLWLASYVFSQSGDHGPDAGYFGMAVVLGSMLYWPLPVTAVLLLVAYPKREAWGSRFVLLGVLSAAIGAASLCCTFYATQPLLTFVLSDNNGARLRGVSLRRFFWETPIAFTDREGTLVQRMKHGRGFQGSFTADGYQNNEVSVSVSGLRQENVEVVSVWYRREGDGVEQTATDHVSYPLTSSLRIPIVMKPIPKQ